MILRRNVRRVQASFQVWQRLRFHGVQLQSFIVISGMGDCRHCFTVHFHLFKGSKAEMFRFKLWNLTNWSLNVWILHRVIRNYIKRRLLSFESIGPFCCNHWAHRPMRYLSLYLVGLNTSFDSHHTLWQSKTRHTKRWLLFLHSVLLRLPFFNWSPLEWDTIVLIWNVPEYRGLSPLNLMS